MAHDLGQPREALGILRGEIPEARLRIQGVIAVGFSDEGFQKPHAIATSAFDKEPLGVQTPDEIGVGEFGTEIGAGCGDGFGTVLGKHPVNAAERPVAQRRNVSRAGAALHLRLLEGRARTVVLNDNVIPIRDPHRAVGTGFGGNGRGPRVGAGIKIVAVELGEKIRVLRPQPSQRHKMSGGFADEGGAVPPFDGKAPAGVNGMSGGRGVVTGLRAHASVAEHFHRRIPAVRSLHVLRDGENLRPALRAMHRPAVADNLPARLAVGGGAEHVELLRKAQPPCVVAGLAEKFQRRAVGPEPEHAGVEFQRTSADHALEPRIPDGRINPAIEAIAQIRHSGVRVVHLEPLEQHAPLVGTVVAVGILEEYHARPVGGDDSAVGMDHGSRQRQPFCEDGEGIRPSIAVGVFADFQPVAARAVRGHIVRIIQRLHHPQPSALVPRESDGTHHVRLRGEQRHGKPRRHLRALQRGFRRERLLHLRRLPVRLVALRQHRRVIFQRGQDGRQKVIPRRPTNATLQQFVKSLLRPAPLVVAVRSVEDTALPLRPRPRPRLVLVALQHREIARQPVMPIRFIPGLERRVALHRRMLRRHHPRGENSFAMPFDLSADQSDISVRFLEARRAAMHRHKAPTPLDEFPHRVELLRRDGLVVRIDEQHIITRQILRCQRLHPFLVSQMNPPMSGDFFEKTVTLQWMVIRVVAKEQHLHRPAHPPTLFRAGHQPQAGPEQAQRQQQPSSSTHGLVRDWHSSTLPGFLPLPLHRMMHHHPLGSDFPVADATG